MSRQLQALPGRLSAEAYGTGRPATRPGRSFAQRRNRLSGAGLKTVDRRTHAREVIYETRPPGTAPGHARPVFCLHEAAGNVARRHSPNVIVTQHATTEQPAGSGA